MSGLVNHIFRTMDRQETLIRKATIDIKTCTCAIDNIGCVLNNHNKTIITAFVAMGLLGSVIFVQDKQIKEMQKDIQELKKKEGEYRTNA